MDSTDSFNGVQSVEFEGSSVECPGEVAVAGVVLLLDLEVGRLAGTVVHGICVVDRIADVESVSGVVGVACFCVELVCFLVPCVFGIGVDSFLIKSFLDNFASDQPFGSFEILHGANNFRISWDGIFFEIGLLGSLIALDPGRSVLLVGCVIK